MRGPGGPTGPGVPGGPAYRPPSSGGGNRAIIAAIITVVVLGLIGVVLIGALVFRRSADPADPSPAPTTMPTDPASRPQNPGDPLAPAPAGQPPTGDLRERVDRAYGSFEPIRRSGRGSETIDLPAEAAQGIVWVKSSGDDWFEVEAEDRGGQAVLLYYSGDAGEGTVPYGSRTPLSATNADESITRLIVEARDTPWELEVRPYSSAPVFTGEAAGKSNAVLIYDGPGEPVQLEYRGTSNFIVAQHGERRNGLSNEIGNTSLEGTLEGGLSIIEIEAWDQGDWTLRRR